MDKITFDERKYITPSRNKYFSRLAPQKMVKLILRDGVTRRQRQILMLYFYQKKNMIEIAQLLGINKSTVSRTIKRGLVHIHEYLKFYAEQKKDDE